MSRLPPAWSTHRYWRTRVGPVVMYHGRSGEIALDLFHNQALPAWRRGILGSEAVCECQVGEGPWRRVVGAAGQPQAPTVCRRCGGAGTIEEGYSACPWCDGRGVRV